MTKVTLNFKDGKGEVHVEDFSVDDITKNAALKEYFKDLAFRFGEAIGAHPPAARYKVSEEEEALYALDESDKREHLESFDTIRLRLFRRRDGRVEFLGEWADKPPEAALDADKAREWITAWSGGGSYDVHIYLPDAERYRVFLKLHYDLAGEPKTPETKKEK